MSTIDIDLTYEQQRWLNILPRVGAGISLCCSFYLVITVVSNPYYRKRIYHRIMAACALNIVVLNATSLWGSAAVPYDSGLLGARGNTATCSAQGWLLQFSQFVVPSYYVALSLLSYFSIRHKFHVPEYQHIEKWIHVSVYIFPIASACYLLYLEAFNKVVIGCYVASEPIGCGDQSPEDEYIPCIRGPENIGQLQKIFLAIPSVLVVFIPTAVMLVLYLQVRSRPGGKQIAKSVAKQSGLYVLVQYWTYLFRFLDAALLLAVGEYAFGTNLLANFIESLQGLWTLCVYLYFRSAPPPSASEEGQASRDGERDGHQNTRQYHNDMSISFKFGNGSTILNTSSESMKANINSRYGSKELSQQQDSSTKERFSIFDGTNALDLDSPWARFLLDEGEDKSYIEDSHAEYDDTQFDIKAGIVVMPKLSEDHPKNGIAAGVRDSEITLETAPCSSRTVEMGDEVERPYPNRNKIITLNMTGLVND